MSKKKPDRRKVSVISRRVKNLREKIESYTEAATFAEAGLQKQAQEIIRGELAESAKVLVVGHGDVFSRDVMDYTASFAERMGYDIVAVNITEVQADCHRSGSSREYLCERFKTRCEEKVAPFEEACREKGITFSHLVRFGELHQCIQEVLGELRRVECVIAERESCPDEEKLLVPVFCLTS